MAEQSGKTGRDRLTWGQVIGHMCGRMGEEQGAGSWGTKSHFKYLAFTLNQIRSYQRFKQRTGVDRHTEQSLRVENDCKRAKEGRESVRNCRRIQRRGTAVEADRKHGRLSRTAFT